MYIKRCRALLTRLTSRPSHRTRLTARCSPLGLCKAAMHAVASMANWAFAVTQDFYIIISSTERCSKKKKIVALSIYTIYKKTKHVGVQEDSWMTDCRVKASVCPSAGLLGNTYLGRLAQIQTRHNLDTHALHCMHVCVHSKYHATTRVVNKQCDRSSFACQRNNGRDRQQSP